MPMKERRQAWFIAAALAMAALVGVVLTVATASASGPPPTAASNASGVPAGQPGVKTPAKVAGKSAPRTAASPSPPARPAASAEAPSSVVPLSTTGLPPVVRKIDTADPVVFITIDDGYTHDPALITLMKQRQMPITVFLVRAAVNGDYAYFKALKDAGATIQDHTLTHPFLSRHTAAFQQREICGAADVYQQRLGGRPWMLRPPYGDFSTTTRAAAKACGMKYIAMWNASLPHAVLRGGSGGKDKLAAGDIVLVHFRANFVRDLSALLDQIDAWGLRVGRLEDYLPA